MVNVCSNCCADVVSRSSALVTEAPELDFGSDASFIEWELLPAFNATLDPYSFSVMALFRTRQDGGMIFSAASHSRLEHLKVDVRGFNVV